MGGQRPAGARYPHATTAAKQADHRFCAVLEHLRQDIRAGNRQWGELVELGQAADFEQARDAERGLYRARSHTGRTCGDEPLSIRVHKQPAADGSWSLWVQVWTRAAGQAHVASTVGAGQKLAYNVQRR
jgi:hypothetical protein